MRYSLLTFLTLTLSLPQSAFSQAQSLVSLDNVLTRLQSGAPFLVDLIIAPNGDIHAVSLDKSAELAYNSDFAPQPTSGPPSPIVVYSKINGPTGAIGEASFEMHRGEEKCLIGLDNLRRPYILYAWELIDFGDLGVALVDSSGIVSIKTDKIGLWAGSDLSACTGKDNHIVVTSSGAVSWVVAIGENLRVSAENLTLTRSFQTIAPLSGGYLIASPGILVDAHGSQHNTTELLVYCVLDASLAIAKPQRQISLADMAEASADGIELAKPIYVTSGSSLLFFTTAQRSDGSVVTYRVRFDEKGEPVRSSQPSSIHLVTREAISQAGQPIHFGVLVKETSNPKVPRREPYFCGVTPEGDMFYYKSTVTFKPKPTLSQTLRGGRP